MQPNLANRIAVVRDLDPPPDPVEALVRLAGRRHCIFFDSAVAHPTLGRYSFLAADPFDVLQTEVGARAQTGHDPLGELAERLASFPCQTIEGLPPFQGGAAGLFGYELGRSLENLPAARLDPFGLPAMVVGLYDVVLAWDHRAERAWIVSQGFPEVELAARVQRAEFRASQLQEWLAGPPIDAPSRQFRSRAGSLPQDVARDQFGPQYDVPAAPGLASNFSPAGYEAAVARAIEYIHAGDVFQVNLSQRLLAPAASDAVSLYLRLRQRNAAPLAGYFDLGDFQIASASPERFLRVAGGRVEARPIKGTRRRLHRGEADLYSGDELRASDKDRAENVMIVDLMRNDLSKFCTPGSVHVPQICQLENYAFVQHLVSSVQGELREGATALDAVRAAFPGGSVTGAPKIRAMQIITELEQLARGAYCGGLGYVGFDGQMDMSILIRTITAGRGWWQLPVGGGIVAQSTPRAEYEETLVKAAGLVRSLH